MKKPGGIKDLFGQLIMIPPGGITNTGEYKDLILFCKYQ